MNRLEHLLTSSVFLNIIFGIWIITTNFENLWSKFIAFFVSMIFYFIGAGLPDIDHEKVQQKVFFLRPLARITRHRGHIHSITASLVWGGVVLLLTVFILYYWYITVIFGICGFLSHLIADDLNRWSLKVKPTRALKVI